MRIDGPDLVIPQRRIQPCGSQDRCQKEDEQKHCQVIAANGGGLLVHKGFSGHTHKFRTSNNIPIQRGAGTIAALAVSIIPVPRARVETIVW